MKQNSGNSNLLLAPPNFNSNNNEIKTLILKNNDLPSIFENKDLYDREPLLGGYMEAPANFQYQEDKTTPLIQTPLFIFMTFVCIAIYGIIFYIISQKR